MTSGRLVPKIALLGGGALVVLLLVGAPGLGQSLTPEGELSDAECYGHHKQEGFRSMDLFPQVVSQAPRGQPFEFQVTVRNPWLHDIVDLFGYVNISDAPGLSFPGEQEPYTETLSGSIAGSPQSYVAATHVVPVEANATELIVSLVGDPGQEAEAPLGVPVRLGNDFDLALRSPNGAVTILGPDPEPEASGPTTPTGAPTASEGLRIGQENLTLGGTGDWTVEVRYRGTSQQGAYDLGVGVFYNLSKSTQFLVPGPAKLGPGEQHTFTFTILAKDASDLQALRYGGIATAYHEHTDRNIESEGLYNKWNTLVFPMGDTLVVGQAVIVDTGVDLLGPLFKTWGQVLGFASSFLIIPSLVFGGTFGRGSVVMLNKMMGSPRRRVLFHNSMSFWLLGLAVMHLFLFLYEAFWNWSHGLVWGGLSLACMIGLGVTGATQRRFVAKWGFARWRFVHFAMGILVFVFVLIHMVADGSHLAFAREWLGATK